MSNFPPQNLPNMAGKAAPPIRPVGPQHQPATRGDIADVVEQLDAIRAVLEQIRDQGK
jgi:hypothetical protein